jgi:uncharacterized protein YprB with RNaseH-like and TPR domain
MDLVELPLPYTFQHLTSIGENTEMDLWRHGIRDWRDFRETAKVNGISDRRKHYLDWEIYLSEHMIYAGRLDYFWNRLPGREIWRLYPHLRAKTAFLDIETDGLHSRARVTVLGVALGNTFSTLIRGRNLNSETVSRTLKGAKAIATFNGTTFDLPILRREFPGVLPHVPHLDLRFLGQRVGLKGGLKLLECELGIGRDPEVQMLAGHDAVRLWRVWHRKGHKRALELLVDYNREDVLNMRPLAEEIFRRHWFKMKERMRSIT